VTAALALAIVLAVAVAGVSMAMEGQKETAGPVRSRRSVVRPPTVRGRPLRDRGRDKARPQAGAPEHQVPERPAEETKGPELLRTGKPAQAKVVSVVDERVIGPVTRSRLVLSFTPEAGAAQEVTLRFAFPSLESRAAVKVGGSIPVRYDPEDPRRVVVDLP